MLRRRDGYLAWIAADLFCAACVLTASRYDALSSLWNVMDRDILGISGPLILYAGYIATLAAVRHSAVCMLATICTRGPFPGVDYSVDATENIEASQPFAPGESELPQGRPESASVARRALFVVLDMLVFAVIAVVIMWRSPGVLPMGASIAMYAAVRLWRMSTALGVWGTRDMLHPDSIELGGRRGGRVALSGVRVTCTRPLPSAFQWVILECGKQGVHDRFLHAEAVRLLLQRVRAARHNDVQ